VSATLHRRLDKLSAVAPPGGCRDPWHNSEAARFAVVYEDMSTGVVPEPPRCPTCNAPPDLTITVVYEKEAWRRLNDVSELRRTTISWE